MDYIDQSARGLLVGIFIGILIFYVFQPKTPYPRWMLAPYDHPWVMIPVIVIIIMMFRWDPLLSLLLVLVILGVAIDVSVYGKTFIPMMDERKEAEFKSTNSSTAGGNLASIARPFGVPVSSATIQMDVPIPHYPVFLGVSSPQPGEPSPF